VVQGLAVIEPEDKREALRRLIRAEDVKNAIIFCNRKRDVDILFRSLKKHGFDAAALHGDMPQSKRTETLERFRNGDIRLLVASDVAARGLDIQGMSHVFNFDVPIHAEDYVHRIGRTGRAGREGKAFTLAAPEEGRFVQAIEQLIGKPIPPVEVAGLATATLVFEEGKRRRGRGERSNREDRPRRSGPRESGPREPRAPAPRRQSGPQQSAGRPASGPVPTFSPITMSAEGADNKVTPLPRRNDHHYRDDDGARVVGFGDHMPAFLARPAKKIAQA
jgi:superfamily II DNA/RNA helicase